MDIFGISHQAFLGQLMLGLVNGAFYALLSLGLAVIFGLLGIVNFAHGALYMLGAFAAWLLLDRFGLTTFPTPASGNAAWWDDKSGKLRRARPLPLPAVALPFAT
jgi:branched-subunit amino acid ABC-type transport system permease component